jgi:hypothetical protein
MDFEDQLRRRMALAKQQGWDDAEIQRSATIERARNLQQQQTQTAPQQPQQRSGGISDFLIGLLPGGSIINKARHGEHITGGDVATEAALTFLPFGLGKVAGAVRAGRAAVTGIKAAEAANDARRVLPTSIRDLFKPQAASPANAVVDAGGRVRAFSRGVTPGATVEGSTTRLRPDAANNTNRFLDTDVQAKGSVRKQVRQVQDYQNRANEGITNVVTRQPISVAPQDIKASENRIMQSLYGENGRGVGNFDPNNKLHMDIVNNYVRQQNGIKDTAGRLNFKRTLDNDINYNRNSGAVDPVREQIATAFRREQADELARLHPAVVPFNQAYGQSEEALNALIRQARPGGIKPFGTSVNGQGFGGGTIQNLMDRFGRGVQTAGKVASTPLGEQAVVHAPFSAHNLFTPSGSNEGAGTGLALDQPATPGTDPVVQALAGSGVSDFNQLANLLGGAGIDTSGLGSDTAGQQPHSTNGLQYSSVDLANAAQQALFAGDMNGYKALADAADQASSIEAAQAKSAGGNGLNVTKVTAQQYGLAQSGLGSLDQLRQMIQSDPGVITRTATPGRKLPIIGGFISNAAGTGEYDALGYNIADSILRLRTGATANEGEVRNLQAQIMPRAGDSNQTIQRKIQQIEQIFGPILQLAQQPSSSSSFPDDLMQMLTGQGQQYAY